MTKLKTKVNHVTTCISSIRPRVLALLAGAQLLPLTGLAQPRYVEVGELPRPTASDRVEVFDAASQQLFSFPTYDPPGGYVPDGYVGSQTASNTFAFRTLPGLSGSYWGRVASDGACVYSVPAARGGQVQLAPVKSPVVWWSTTTVPNLLYPNGRALFQTFIHQGRLYVLGGWKADNQPPNSDVEYAPVLSDGSLGDFAQTSPLPVGMYGHSATVASNGTLYVAYRTNLFSAQIAPDGSIGSWTTQTPVHGMNHINYGNTGMALLGDLLVIVDSTKTFVCRLVTARDVQLITTITNPAVFNQRSVYVNNSSVYVAATTGRIYRIDGLPDQTIPHINDVSFFLDRVGQAGSGALIGVSASATLGQLSTVTLERISTQPGGPWAYTFNYSEMGTWRNWNYNPGPSWWDNEDITFKVIVADNLEGFASTVVTCPLRSYLGPVQNINITPRADGYHITFDPVPNAKSYSYGIWRNDQLQGTTVVTNISELSILGYGQFQPGESVSITAFAEGSFPFTWDGHQKSGQLRAYETASFIAIAGPPILYTNQVLALDGTNGCAVIPSAANLTPTNEMTIECWFYVARPLPTVPTVQAYLLNKGDNVNASSSRSYDLAWHPASGGSNDRLDLNLFLAQSNWVYMTVSAPRNRWIHYAMSFDGQRGEVKGYVNGLLTASVTNGLAGLTLRQTGQPLIFGRSQYYAGSYYWPGSIDEVRIWNKARTPKEIYEHMYCRLTGTESNLVACWNFDSGGVSDLTANARHGYLVASAQIIPISGNDAVHAGECGFEYPILPPAISIKALPLGPQVIPVMELDMNDLLPYAAYQLEFNPALSGTWTNLGAPFIPGAVTNTQYVNGPARSGFFRVKKLP